MFQDANLPDSEAWQAMTQDLRKAKEQRNTLSKENAYVNCGVMAAAKLTHSLLDQVYETEFGVDAASE